MSPTTLDCVGVLLTVLVLVVTPVAGAGGTVAVDASKHAETDVADAVGGADEVERDGAGLGQDSENLQEDEADNGTPGDDAVGISNARLTVAGTTIWVDQALFSIEEGTATAFLKTLSVSTADGTANVTNLRVAVGERIRQRLASEVPRVAGTQFSVSAGQVDVGGLTFRLLPGAISGQLGGGAQPAPNETTDAVDERSTYEVSNFTAPDRVPVGERINVSARVTNPGEGNDSEVVRYVFGEVAVNRKLVELEGGESTVVNFSVGANALPSETGNYTHGIRAFNSNVSATIELVGENETSANASRPAVGG